jgi:D-arabinose 1-dehydrogenase-like Zn-dependent alcohol dehydrogenase
MLAGRLDVKNRRFAMHKVSQPHPGPGEVRIKVMAAGVCLSDVHLIDGTLRPLYLHGDVVTLGHEVAGMVDAIGEGVPGWRPGRRVLLKIGHRDRSGTILIRGVDYDGGWAEYALAREDTLVAIPDELPFEQACIIPDAVSTPWAAVSSTAGVRPGQAVGVWGVGGLGAHGVQLLRMAGAAPIIAVDPLPAARERAQGLGADLALDPADPELRERIGGLTAGRGLDVAFDFAGVPDVRDQALELLGRGGRLVLVGIAAKPVNIESDGTFIYLQRGVVGHYASEPEHVEQLVSLVKLKRLDFSRSVSGIFPLEEAPEVVERLQRREDNPIRFILKP